MPTNPTPCAGCCTDPDCDCIRECINGKQTCDVHFGIAAKFWATQFGYRPGVTKGRIDGLVSGIAEWQWAVWMEERS